MLSEPYEVPIGALAVAGFTLLIVVTILILLVRGRKSRTKKARRPDASETWVTGLRPVSPPAPTVKRQPAAGARDDLYQYIVRTASLYGLTTDGPAVFVPVPNGIHADLARRVNTAPNQHSNGWMVRYINGIDIGFAEVAASEDLLTVKRTRYHDWS